MSLQVADSFFDSLSWQSPSQVLVWNLFWYYELICELPTDARLWESIAHAGSECLEVREVLHQSPRWAKLMYRNHCKHCRRVANIFWQLQSLQFVSWRSNLSIDFLLFAFSWWRPTEEFSILQEIFRAIPRSLLSYSHTTTETLCFMYKNARCRILLGFAEDWNELRGRRRAEIVRLSMQSRQLIAAFSERPHLQRKDCRRFVVASRNRYGNSWE